MATFTTAQQAQVRMYLGYPDLYRYQNVRLEGIITGDQISVDALALVAGILVQLTAIDSVIYGAGGGVGITVAAAGIKKADEVEFFAGQSIRDLNSIRRELTTRISNMLGVPFFGDAMGESGYPGDTLSVGGLGPGNGQNLIGIG